MCVLHPKSDTATANVLFCITGVDFMTKTLHADATDHLHQPHTSTLIMLTANLIQLELCFSQSIFAFAVQFNLIFRRQAWCECTLASVCVHACQCAFSVTLDLL